MKTLLSLLTLLILIPAFSTAQIHLLPGYYVNNQKDTIRGFIEHGEKYNSPKEFYFKANASQQAKKISLAGASAFGITGYDYYERFVAPVSKNYTTLSRLTTTVDSSFTIDTVFLKIIKKGKNVSMYSFSDNVKTRFYVVESSEKKAVELNYYEYLDDETHSTVPEYTFRLQLLNLANKYQQDAVKLTALLGKTQYEEADIYKVIQLINGSNEGRLTSKDAQGVRFFLGVSGRQSKLAFTGLKPGVFGDQAIFYDGTNKSVFAPTISGGVDFLINKETQKLIFRGEISLSTADYSFVNEPISTDGTTATADFKQFNVILYPQLIIIFTLPIA